jgi:thymidylate synthase ThyX
MPHSNTPFGHIAVEWDTDLAGAPNRDWGKLHVNNAYVVIKGKEQVVPIYAVAPQAHLIATTIPVGMLCGYSPDSVLTKAFQKNYHSAAAKPGVVSSYGFQQKHGEPIELIDYVFETIFDRACEAEMNRYRHNSKNYESGRYVDYLKHGVTVVLPHEPDIMEAYDLSHTDYIHPLVREWVSDVVIGDLWSYAKYLDRGWKKQHARRAFGTYLAVEAVIKTNLRSLTHMGTQRSAVYSPNGKEAEPEISAVVTQMIAAAMPYLPVFAKDVFEQMEKGYR